MSMQDRLPAPSSTEIRPTQPRAEYVAPRIEKTQKLVEVTGMATSGFVPPPV